MEVESTTRSAKERVAGFEGREGHRTPFAPVGGKDLRLQVSWNGRKFRKVGSGAAVLVTFACKCKRTAGTHIDSDALMKSASWAVSSAIWFFLVTFPLLIILLLVLGTK